MDASQLELKVRKDSIRIKLFFIVEVVVSLMLFLSIGYLVYDSRDTKRYLRQVQNTKIGIASWYAKGNYKDGTVFKGHLYSCASDYFDRYDLLMVENVITKKKVLVWNNDSHEATDIVVDLSKNAFKRIALLKSGKIIVKVTRLGAMRDPNPEIFGKIHKY